MLSDAPVASPAGAVVAGAAPAQAASSSASTSPQDSSMTIRVRFITGFSSIQFDRLGQVDSGTTRRPDSTHFGLPYRIEKWAFCQSKEFSAEQGQLCTMGLKLCHSAGAPPIPCLVMELAQAAEAAGWEGIVLWDHLLFPYGAGDPWVTLAAIAAVTSRIKLCTGVAALLCDKPQVLARTLAGLDMLSNGRVSFPALGPASILTSRPLARRLTPGRVAMLDEGLGFLHGLLSSRSRTRGAITRRRMHSLSPAPCSTRVLPTWDRRRQQGRLPPRRPVGWLDHRHGGRTAEHHPAAGATGRNWPSSAASAPRTGPFDIAVDGCTQPNDGALVAEYAAAGQPGGLKPSSARVVCISGVAPAHQGRAAADR